MSGEKLGNGGERANGIDQQDAGKKVLELSVIPEGMTVEQYEDYLKGMTDRFGNPEYSKSTRETLAKKYAAGELSAQQVNPVAEASAEDIRKANEAAEQEKQSQAERILAGREAGEVLNSINTELQELEWAKWNLEQFLAAHGDKTTAESAVTYSQQLDTIKNRMNELTGDKNIIEQELGVSEQPLPDMGERAAIDANEPIQRDQTKLMSAMGRMLEKWRNRRNEPEVELLATEPGAEPRAEEFDEEAQAKADRLSWYQKLRSAASEHREGDWMSEEEKRPTPEQKQQQEREQWLEKLQQAASEHREGDLMTDEEKAERREALKRKVEKEIKYRSPWKKYATQALLGAMVATAAFNIAKRNVDAAEASSLSLGGRPRVESEGSAFDIEGATADGQRSLIDEALANVAAEAVGTMNAVENGDIQEVELSFEDRMLLRGQEAYAGFMDLEGSEMDEFGVMGNYTQGWDLNKPGSNHFGPDLSLPIKECIEEGRDVREALPEVIKGTLFNYQMQPECLVSYMASFPNTLQKCGVSDEIIGIKDVPQRIKALTDLLYSEEGGGILQMKLYAAAEETMLGEGAEIDLIQVYDKVITDYLALKPGETRSGVGKMEIRQDVKQRHGEYHLVIHYGGDGGASRPGCGGQISYIVEDGTTITYDPTTAIIFVNEATEESLVESVEEASHEESVEGQPEEIVEKSEEGSKHEETDEEETPSEEEGDSEEEEEEEEDDDEEDGEGEDTSTDDGKKPEDALNVLNPEKVTDGQLTQTKDVNDVETETDLGDVTPVAGAQQQVVGDMVEDQVGDSKKQEEIDQATDNEDITTDAEKEAAIAEFLKQLGGGDELSTEGTDSGSDEGGDNLGGEGNPEGDGTSGDGGVPLADGDGDGNSGGEGNPEGDQDSDEKKGEGDQAKNDEDSQDGTTGGNGDGTASGS